MAAKLIFDMMFGVGILFWRINFLTYIQKLKGIIYLSLKFRIMGTLNYFLEEELLGW